MADEFTRAIRSVVRAEIDVMEALGKLVRSLRGVRCAVSEVARALWRAHTVGWRAVRIVRQNMREDKERARAN
jgi:arginase family enzyme